ncbi:hypothetical protein [Moritella sp.]|uniref:hypothetical protein n=1 Tax=Moritella sp. TaxID=78556 RepID=UPI001D754BB6|nr:hypothetical protein [Moritella sp.]MCJ8350464.1 hypothetical protein [Moritella sp.]NQZ40157.1 hypothetical protein [Moritella sp.]
MNQTMKRNDDRIRITVLSFMGQHPLLIDIENNDDINLQSIIAEHEVMRDSNLLQSDLVVVVYQQVNISSVGYISRRKIIDDNYIATIWLNLDELNTYHTLAALRFINHMASMLNQNKLLKFNISDISSLISNSKSLRFLEADDEEIADVLAENDSKMSQHMVKNVIPDPTIADSAAMIIVTKEPISIHKINAGFDVINQVCEHKVPCYYGVHMSPKYSAKHTYLYLVGER